MRRDEARRPRVLLQQGTRAATELPPGPLRVPARSWLKARSARGCVTDRTKARPAAEQTPQMACACLAHVRGAFFCALPLRCFSAFFDALPLRYLSACWRAERRPPHPVTEADTTSLRFSARHPPKKRGEKNKARARRASRKRVRMSMMGSKPEPEPPCISPRS